VAAAVVEEEAGVDGAAGGGGGRCKREPQAKCGVDSGGGD
jgi:hypothetical protein